MLSPNGPSYSQRRHTSTSPSRDLSLRRGLGETPRKQYTYSPLPTETSIRLIEWPNKLVPTADLRFTLRTIDLATSDRPSYTTISYTWGADSGQEAEDVESLNDLFTNTVVCDDCYLRVTENAHIALQELQWRGRSHLFWMDAVCIDQSNLEERSQQVAMMGDIYANAERTIVWLGEDDESAHAAHRIVQNDNLKANNRHPNLLSQTWVSAHLELELKESRLAILRLQLPLHPPKDLTDLLAFFSRPWFQRLWIIQEVVLAKHLWILCGGLMFDWQALIDVAHDVLLNDSLQDLSSGELVSKGIHGLFVVRMIAFLRGDYTSFQRMALSIFGPVSGPSEFSAIVGTLVGLFDRSLLSDSRDRIYAPLALAGRICSSSPSVLLSPDYAQSAEEVFVNTALYLIQQSQSLSIFSMHKTTENGSSHLPSWVPDLRIRSAQKATSTLCSCDATKGWLGDSPFESSFQQPSSNFLMSSTINDQDPELLDCISSLHLRDELCLQVTGLMKSTISRTSDCISTLLVNDEFLPVLMFLKSSPECKVNRTLIPQLLLQLLTLGSLWTDNPLVESQPVEYDFSAWFSFKLLSSHCHDRISAKDIATLLDLVHVPPSIQVRSNSSKRMGSKSFSKSQGEFYSYSLGMSFSNLPRWSGTDDDPESELSFISLVKQANKIHKMISESFTNTRASSELIAYWSRAYRFESACKPYITDRCIFLTKEGDLGVCPRTARYGDQIWFLKGSRTPVVLRPRDGHQFEFVGEVYLRGYMQGEICSEYGPQHLQSILLR